MDKVTVLEHGADELPKLWEAPNHSPRVCPMLKLSRPPFLGSHFKNIHPSGKRTVGQRLSNLALTKVYRQTAPAWRGSLFDKLEIKGNQAVVHLPPIPAENLPRAMANAPDNFEIAGADGVFKPAIATISGNAATLTSTDVAQPTAARMGWTETAQPNLTNVSGLPAYPFRSNGPDWHPSKNN